MSWESILKRFVTQRELDVLINEFKMMLEDDLDEQRLVEPMDFRDTITRLRLLARDELDVKQLLNEDFALSSKFMSEYGYDIDNFYVYELDKLEHVAFDFMSDETQEQFEEIKEAILWRVRNS